MHAVDIATVVALKVALEGAQHGTLRGIAAVEFYEGGYRFSITGAARDNPALAASAMLVAQLEVARSANLPASLVLQARPLVFRGTKRAAADRVEVAGARDAVADTPVIVSVASVLTQTAPDTA